MSSRRIVSIVALALALAASKAHGFFDPPWITPEAPTAGETVSVNVHGGVCDAIFESPGYPQITREGNAIRIVEYGDHVTFNDFCIYGVGTLTEPIGTFPPGDYTLTVDLLYNDWAFGYTTVNIGIVPFTVTDVAPAIPVPTSDRWGAVRAIAVCAGASRKGPSRSATTK